MRGWRRPVLVLELVVLAALAKLLRRLLARKPALAAATTPALPAAVYGAAEMTLLRRARVAKGAAWDHAEETVPVKMKGFDLDRTIFRGVKSVITRAVLKERLSAEPYWADHAAQRIRRDYAALPRAPAPDAPLLAFMRDECDFAMEHADGSFLDHLEFCFEYSHAHFRGHSPRVLLLHSILGVATNYFPMSKDKVPQLRALVTDAEFRHVEAFPAVLRLLLSGVLLDALAHDGELVQCSFHAVLDNAEVTLRGDELWTHLNYQLIHLLDFLPASNWRLHAEDRLLVVCRQLHALLKSRGKLACTVDLGTTDYGSGPPLTLASLLQAVAPSRLQTKLATDQVRAFSAEIGHSLECQLEWA